MQDYSYLGLNRRLQSVTGPVSTERMSAYQLDSTLEPNPGIIDYSRITSPGRAYSAVVSLSKTGGAFTDIQDAFDYVNSLGGGRILVQSGTYVISNNLTIYSDTMIEGVAARDCVIDFNNGTNNLSTVASARDISIRNLQFIRCQNTTNGAIYLDSVQRVNITSCLFGTNMTSGSVGYDIWAGTPGNVYVSGCRSTSPATFYFSTNSSGASFVSSNYIDTPQDIAIEGGTGGNGGGQTEYANNFFSSPRSYSFYGNFNYGNILNNIIAYQAAIAGTAVELGTTSFANFMGNNVENTVGSIVQMNLQNCTSCKLIGNRFNQGGTGVSSTLTLRISDNNLISNNTITGNAPSVPLIDLGTNSDSNSIIGNFINTGVSGTQDGIRLTDADNNVILGNVVFGDTTGSYAVNISNGACSSNVVVGNYLNGAVADVNDLGTLSTVANNN